MRVKLFVAALLLAPVGYLGTSSAGVGPQEDTAQVKEVAGYRQWERITPRPVPIDFPSAMG